MYKIEELGDKMKNSEEYDVLEFGPKKACNTEHYDVFEVKLSEEEKESGAIRLDPYRVAKEWDVGVKDPSGCLFHILKTIARFGIKSGNTMEREMSSILATITRLIEISKPK